jgi:Rad51
LTKSSLLDRNPEPDLSTGIAAFDRALVLKFGQLLVLQGKPAYHISLLLCARATSPSSRVGEVVFMDGGNNFDTYAISNYSMALGLDLEKVRGRIHLSRAFTHHQLALLTGEKLASALKENSAKLAIVSDITALYCDPDVKDKEEALDVFRKSIKNLASLAEQSSTLIIITNLESRDQKMENSLFYSAHAFAKLEDKGPITRMTVTKHPFNVPKEAVTFDPQTLSTSLDEHFQ